METYVEPAPTRARFAVIGSGVAGLSAAWTLAASGAVTLYEADGRLGGHADTHLVPEPGRPPVPVDTGFIVHNQRTYPTLLRLFAELGVQTRESDMSMSVRCDGCGLEYAGARGVSGLVPDARTLTRGRYLALLAEVPRFHRRARAELLSATHGDDDRTLAQFLAAGRFSPYFVSHFVAPLVSAVWSCDPATALRYPARYLFAFLDNHGMLTVTGSPTWRTVVGGSARYVHAIAERLDAVHTGVPVREVTRTAAGTVVRDASDRVQTFDGVVVATHPDHALRLLGAPTADERRLLGAIPYSRNRATLHTDTAVLPRRHRARASWNYRLPSCTARPSHVLVSYDLTRLQGLEEHSDRRFILSLGDGDGDRVPPESVIESMTYEHPQYTPESVAAQRELASIGDESLAFAGAYHGWGFHEDGAASGLRAANLLRSGAGRSDERARVVVR